MKKGISPLIATVLIIGFTVALAAIIITWSTGFTKRMQTQTEETANVQIICATDVVFSVKNVCKSGTNYNVLIQNDGKEPIKSWKVRVYKNANTVQPLDKAVSIAAFGIGTLTISESELTYSAPKDVRQIEAFPVIERGGKEIVCSQNVNSYGDASGSVIDTAC
jgi:flagellin-like protein